MLQEVVEVSSPDPFDEGYPFTSVIRKDRAVWSL
jgi:hypothetical protein